MLLKTLLNKIEKFSSFVYTKTRISKINKEEAIVVHVVARKNSKGKCPECRIKRPTYDTDKEGRLFSYVPLWGISVYFHYRLRRVSCFRHGIITELIPWAEGKERYTTTYKVFLANWAKRLSWKETAEVFRTSWDTVFNCVKWVVDYGMSHRLLNGITAIGVDEIQAFKGHQYLTMVYQLDKDAKRLLWCGRDRTEEALKSFFGYLGTDLSEKIRYVCTDMWKPYLNVISELIPKAINILDRFHVMKKFNEAIDEIRRREIHSGNEMLKHSRWALMKNEENLTTAQVSKLSELLKSELDSIKAYLLKKDFRKFWTYKTSWGAKRFMNAWCQRTMKTKLEPMKKVSKLLERKQQLILNWFVTDPRLSSGAVEAMNNKAKLTMRKAYGFKTEIHLKYALYHTMGGLEMPKTTHRFNC